MSDDPGFVCGRCGQHHDGLPFSYGVDAPAYWNPEEMVGDPDSLLTDEQCVIKRQHFFIRARLILPVVDAAEDFTWGVWVSLSAANFARAIRLWTDPHRVNEPPYFGWLSTELPYQPSTLNLKTHVHSQPVGVLPTVELEHTDHPLAVEQCKGITVARVQAIAERLLHPGPPVG
jgi:hypothetical protein